jgi:phosphoribosylformimino-5-aminoimidazole carboxamide ribotide isomerase
MARPSAAKDGVGVAPARPPPVTHSWTRIVGIGREVITSVGFRIIPVIDLREAKAVRAVGGRREQYQPLRSIWQASPSPVELANALRAGLGIDHLYVADLDAIEGRSLNGEVHDRLAAEGFRLWLDAGIRDPESLGRLSGIDANRLRVVLGLESIDGPAALEAIIECVGPDRVIFSLDLDEGRPRIATGAAWSSDEPLEIASQAIELGIRRLILLDLARVGMDRGIGTEPLLVSVRTRHPEIAVSVGGGIRGMEDVLRLRDRGASSVLVGSAIHDGRIGRRELERLTLF